MASMVQTYSSSHSPASSSYVSDVISMGLGSGKMAGATVVITHQLSVIKLGILTDGHKNMNIL